MVEQSSGILRWTALKSVLYRLVGGAFFRCTTVDCTENSFMQVCSGAAIFGHTAVDSIENYTGRWGSSLQVYCCEIY